MEEILKDIPGYEQYYQASNMGRVFSKINNMYLKPFIWGGTYKSVGLGFGKKLKNFRISNLILLTFVGPRPGTSREYHANHINGNHLDDRASNLEWCTISENLKHAFRLGLSCQSGERNNFAILTNDKVRAIRKARAIGYKQITLSKHFHVSSSTISDICLYKKWKWLKESGEVWKESNHKT